MFLDQGWVTRLHEAGLQLARHLRGTHEAGLASYRCEHGQGGVAEEILGEEQNPFHLAGRSCSDSGGGFRCQENPWVCFTSCFSY